MRRTKAVEAVVAKPYWREDDVLLVVEAWRRSGQSVAEGTIVAAGESARKWTRPEIVDRAVRFATDGRVEEARKLMLAALEALAERNRAGHDRSRRAVVARRRGRVGAGRGFRVAWWGAVGREQERARTPALPGAISDTCGLPRPWPPDGYSGTVASLAKSGRVIS
jgi:hypothetical protein